MLGIGVFGIVCAGILSRGNATKPACCTVAPLGVVATFCPSGRLVGPAACGPLGAATVLPGPLAPAAPAATCARCAAELAGPFALSADAAAVCVCPGADAGAAA